MTAYPAQTQTTLGQLCAALWDSQSRAGCDTAWSRTRVCSDASSTEMQCLRPAAPTREFNRLDYDKETMSDPWSSDLTTKLNCYVYLAMLSYYDDAKYSVHSAHVSMGVVISM